MSTPRYAGLSVWLGALLALAFHVVLLSYVMPVELAFGEAPIVGADFDTHIGQAYRMSRSLSRWGEVWSYEPQLLAGFPAGVIFDADNKGWGYLTYALQHWFGMPPGRAFNAFVLLAHLALPLVVFGAGRLFDLSWRAALIAMPLASLLWFFDSWARWVWWVGMVAFAFASYLLLLPLGLFHRYLQHGRRWAAVCCGPALGVCLTVHPYAFFVLAPTMGALYLRGVRARPREQHLAVLAIAVTALLINAQWLWASLARFHLILDSAFYAQTGLPFLLSDFFGLLRSPTDTGVIGVRSGFRFAYLALAGIAVYRLSRARDPRALPWGLGLLVTFFAGYLGNHLPGAAQVQPYRFVLPMAFLTIAPAAWLLDRLWTERPFAALAGSARAVFLVVLGLGGLHLSRDVMYFYSHSLPEVQRLIHGTESPLHALGYPAKGYFASRDTRHFVFPHTPDVDPGISRMVGWVGKHLTIDGRVLVEDLALGERLGWQSQVEVIGGFRERNVEHSRANILRHYQAREIPEDVMRRWLHTYAVNWLIMRHEHEEFGEMTELLEGPRRMHHRTVYRVRNPTPRLTGSPGRVRARTNALWVRGTAPDADLTLRYHYDPQLRCRPDCRLRRIESEFDEVGLIGVPAPHPADFVVELRYE